MNENLHIFESINVGLVILGSDYTIAAWNRWMEHHSGLRECEVIGKNLFDAFPNLAAPKYRRSFKSVLTFGNYAYFSQKLHHYLFPMKNLHAATESLPLMQQSCSAGPLRNDTGQIDRFFIAVEDVTENVVSEMKMKQKIAELEEALAKVKLLEGIIPICMYCKKIRDVQESWQQMERYITEHSLAQFSHGICPDCMAQKPWEGT